MRFAEKERHQIFLEPEGLDPVEVYPNGIPTSLPIDVQIKMVRSVAGLERAEILRPGYAIEYDFVNPLQLKPTLETKLVEGLIHAGQINGTSGYEEAAAQGVMAGINAVLKVRGQEPLVLERSQAYIGVLLDDLVTKGTNEPYRMFTSRAEYRLLLREDNADFRLRDTGFRLGLVPEEVYRQFCGKREAVEKLVDQLNDIKIRPEPSVVDQLKGHRGISLKKGCISTNDSTDYYCTFTVLLVSAGLFFFLAASIGFLRFPDLYTRMHAVGRETRWGCCCACQALPSITCLIIAAGTALCRA